MQREPFDVKGEPADRFDPNRFARHRLRHVEITFATPVEGPIAIGDGRFLGLGVMRPEEKRKTRRAVTWSGIHAFTLRQAATIAPADIEPLARALRRAVMARADTTGRARGLLRGGASCRPSSPVISTTPRGQRRSGPAASGQHEHLFFAVDAGDDGTLPGSS